MNQLVQGASDDLAVSHRQSLRSRSRQQSRRVDISRRRVAGECMNVGQPCGPRPPEGLRPAQLGIILVGRVILGHVSATLVDLAQRGVLSLDETHDRLDAADDGAGRGLAPD